MSLTRMIIKHVQWPLMERLKGNRIRAYLRDLQGAQSLPADLLRERQEAQLDRLLQHAAARVPAYQPYRDVLLDTSLPAPERLRQLPPLTKESFRNLHDHYLAADANPKTLIANRTGGSTGEPVRFYLHRPAVERYEAARWLGLSWHRIGIGDPSVMIWGSPIELNAGQSRRYRLKERYLKNRLMISAYEIKPRSLPDYVRLLRSFRPEYLYGYATALHLLADLILQQGIELNLPLKAVVSTAETLHPYQREAIGQAFQAPVVNEYGARDGGILAYQCPAGKMHTFTENCYLEVVDLKEKKPVPPGQPGLLLVTDLHNPVMPRLRYQLGDVVQWSQETCSCGISFPVFASIDGREDDMFLTASGQYVHGHFFNHIVRSMESFRTFQIIQHEPDRITLKLVRDPVRYRRDEEQQLLERIRDVLGRGIHLAVEHVPEIPPAASGKVRYAIRQFPLPLRQPAP